MQVTEHKPKHSVDKDVQHFCGWKKLLEFIGKAESVHEKNLIAFLFETGGRVNEVLRLRTDMFHVFKTAKPPILIVRGMPLSKRYRKVSELRECSQCHFLNCKGIPTCAKCGTPLFDSKKRFETEKLDAERKEFAIRCDEPLAQIMIKTIIDRIHDSEPYIFAHSLRRKLYSRFWAYKVLRRLGEQTGFYLYPHRLRAERASHLGSTLKAESLLEWFSWESWNTAKKYSKKGALGLAKEMGVEVKDSHMY